MGSAFVFTGERRHERTTEGSLFNYLSLTLFVISVDLLSGSKKWIEERLTTQTLVCGEVSANSIWLASSLKDNHKLNPPSRKGLMNGINNDATLCIEAYGFTACFLRVYVPCACERREGGKRPFLIKKSIPLFCKPTLLPSTQALAVSVKKTGWGENHPEAVKQKHLVLL